MCDVFSRGSPRNFGREGSHYKKYMKYIKIYKKYKTRCPVCSAIDGCMPASLYISWTFVCGAVESISPLYYPAMPQPLRYKIVLTFRSLGVSVSLRSRNLKLGGEAAACSIGCNTLLISRESLGWIIQPWSNVVTDKLTAFETARTCSNAQWSYPGQRCHHGRIANVDVMK